VSAASSTPAPAQPAGRAAAGERLAAHAFTLLVIAAWAYAATEIPPIALSGPWTTAKALWAFVGDTNQLAHMGDSLMHVGIAITLSFFVGSALAFLAHYVPVTALMVHGRISPFLNAFSGIGWALLALLWFGANHLTVIFAISMVLIPFALVNMKEGLATLDRELIEMGRSFGRSALKRFGRITVPSLYPFMFATLRISFGVAWKVALTAELIGGGSGFGYLFDLARQDYRTPILFVVILLIIIFVYCADRFGFEPIQRRLQRHYGSG
jgi:NitT/TauT family transport system permease protein/sulfonate transport system permease protein